MKVPRDSAFLSSQNPATPKAIAALSAHSSHASVGAVFNALGAIKLVFRVNLARERTADDAWLAPESGSQAHAAHQVSARALCRIASVFDAIRLQDLSQDPPQSPVTNRKEPMVLNSPMKLAHPRTAVIPVYVQPALLFRGLATTVNLSLATCIVLAGCSSLPVAIPGVGRSPQARQTVATPNGSTSGSSSFAQSNQSDSDFVSPIGALKLSNVTLRGLAAMGIRDQTALVRWYNAPHLEFDPFLAPMVAELDGATGSAKSIDDLKLSAVTVEALSKGGVTEPSGIAKFDRKALDDSKQPRDLCRNEIANEMRRTGWTILRAQVINRPGATMLALNGVDVGSITKNDKAEWRRFLVEVPGPSSDLRTIATLSVDLPSASDGTPPVRWFKDIELVRGDELQVAIDITSAPIPSIGFTAKTPLSPAAIYAGDEVTLTCEGGDDNTIWFAFSNASELSAANYNTSPSGNTAAAGLPAWFRLRTSAESVAFPRGSLLDEPAMQPIVLGRGKDFVWRPQVETLAARIGALVRDSSGFWGFAERSIAVADLRPGLWSVPALSIDPSTLDAAARAAQAIDPSPINVYETHAILDQLLYVAKVDTPIALDLRLDEYRDASLPLARVTVDFGDGSATVQVSATDAAKAQVEHSYTAEGIYRITVKSTDIMGFERTHGTNVAVRADAPPAPEAAPAAASAAGPSVKLRVAATAAESSFDLFRRAAGQFARTVAARTARACDGRKIGLAHIHDFKDQNLVDLMDGALVSTLLGVGANMYEREPIFQHAIDARGFVDASTMMVPDQGGKVPDSLLSTVADGEKSDAALTMKLLERIGASAVPDVDVVIEYKLKRAEVNVVPAGAMVLRTARIFAWVRVHDRRTMEILFDDAVEVALGGTVAATESTSAGSAWDSYPDGFLLRSGSTDKAIETIEIKAEVSGDDAAAKVDIQEKVDVQEKAALPTSTTPAPVAAPAAPSVGGMLKGMFGG